MSEQLVHLRALQSTWKKFITNRGDLISIAENSEINEVLTNWLGFVFSAATEDGSFFT